MEKTTVSLSLDGEKLYALEHYLGKEGASVQERMDEALRLLYEQTVPEPVREYLDAKSAPSRPKRPPSRPRAAASKPEPVSAEKGDEAGA